jgi:twitching motility protein PilT
VFSTVHTTDAIKTIGRLISLYPAEEQHAVRLRLSDNLHATVSQRLVNSIEPNKKVVAQEIMISNLAIRECIASDKKTGEMNTFIEKGHEVLGSQTFDQHLSFLVQRGQVSVEVALEAATNPADFQRNLAFGEHGHALEGNNAENIQMEQITPTAEDAKFEKAKPNPAPAAATPGAPPKVPKPPKAA